MKIWGNTIFVVKTVTFDFLTPLCSGLLAFRVWDLPESKKNVKKGFWKIIVF